MSKKLYRHVTDENKYEHVKDLLGRLMELVSKGDNDLAADFVGELKNQGYGIPPQSVKTGESVPVIASGYEWGCPSCLHANTEIEVTTEVECKVCHHVYTTDEPNHAYGD